VTIVPSPTCAACNDVLGRRTPRLTFFPTSNRTTPRGSTTAGFAGRWNRRYRAAIEERRWPSGKFPCSRGNDVGQLRVADAGINCERTSRDLR
jgi:hypothetical protein